MEFKENIKYPTSELKRIIEWGQNNKNYDVNEYTDYIEIVKRDEKIIIEELRKRREIECFPVINRGQLWHDSLTEEQKAELQGWYQAWLRVTETLKPPTKPYWLK